VDIVSFVVNHFSNFKATLLRTRRQCVTVIDEQFEQLFDGLGAWSIQAAIASQSGFPVLSTRGRFGH
jgi:hypothetical protein